jgi:hypothetical protein
MNASHGICCYRSGEACKYKWQTLLPEYKRVVDVHKQTGVNSMLYFEMTFGERRNRTLPKKFDAHVYSEMHEWLKHKPTMTPPHFRDLLSPNDGNYMDPPATEEVGNNNMDKHCPVQDQPIAEAALHAHGSAAAYDACAEAMEECDNTPEETTASEGGNQTLPSHPTPPLPTASTVNFFQWNGSAQSAPSTPHVSPMDLNGSAPTSPIVSAPQFTSRTRVDGLFHNPSQPRQQGQGVSPFPRRQGVQPPSPGAPLGPRAASPPHLLGNVPERERATRTCSLQRHLQHRQLDNPLKIQV